MHSFSGPIATWFRRMFGPWTPFPGHMPTWFKVTEQSDREMLCLAWLFVSWHPVSVCMSYATTKRDGHLISHGLCTRLIRTLIATIAGLRSSSAPAPAIAPPSVQTQQHQLHDDGDDNGGQQDPSVLIHLVCLSRGATYREH